MDSTIKVNKIISLISPKGNTRKSKNSILVECEWKEGGRRLGKETVTWETYATCAPFGGTQEMVDEILKGNPKFLKPNTFMYKKTGSSKWVRYINTDRDEVMERAFNHHHPNTAPAPVPVMEREIVQTLAPIQVTDYMHMPVGEQREGEQHEGEQREGEQHEGEQREGEQHEGEQREGEQREGEQREGEQREGEQREGDSGFGFLTMADFMKLRDESDSPESEELVKTPEERIKDGKLEEGQNTVETPTDDVRTEEDRPAEDEHPAEEEEREDSPTQRLESPVESEVKEDGGEVEQDEPEVEQDEDLIGTDGEGEPEEKAVVPPSSVPQPISARRKRKSESTKESPAKKQDRND